MAVVQEHVGLAVVADLARYAVHRHVVDRRADQGDHLDRILAQVGAVQLEDAVVGQAAGHAVQLERVLDALDLGRHDVLALGDQVVGHGGGGLVVQAGDLGDAHLVEELLQADGVRRDAGRPLVQRGLVAHQRDLGGAVGGLAVALQRDLVGRGRRVVVLRRLAERAHVDVALAVVGRQVDLDALDVAGLGVQQHDQGEEARGETVHVLYSNGRRNPGSAALPELLVAVPAPHTPRGPRRLTDSGNNTIGLCKTCQGLITKKSHTPFSTIRRRENDAGMQPGARGALHRGGVGRAAGVRDLRRADARQVAAQEVVGLDDLQFAVLVLERDAGRVAVDRADDHGRHAGLRDHIQAGWLALAREHDLAQELRVVHGVEEHERRRLRAVDRPRNARERAEVEIHGQVHDLQPAVRGDVHLGAVDPREAVRHEREERVVHVGTEADDVLCEAEVGDRTGVQVHSHEDHVVADQVVLAAQLRAVDGAHRDRDALDDVRRRTVVLVEVAGHADDQPIPVRVELVAADQVELAANDRTEPLVVAQGLEANRRTARVPRVEDDATNDLGVEAHLEAGRQVEERGDRKRTRESHAELRGSNTVFDALTKNSAPTEG